MADDDHDHDEPDDPQDEARRRLALAQVRQYPDASLRMRAHEIDDFGDDLERLTNRMISLMHDAHGAGLAATQIGVLQRVFVFQTEEIEPRAIVNPEIVERGKDTNTDTEGCLSLQGVVVPVERTTELTMTGRDVDGTELRLELTDHAARIVQHEIDHLDGILMLDRTTPEARKAALGVLRPRLAFS